MRVAALALFLVACTAQPTSSASPSPSSCRLPVLSIPAQQPGFVNLPGATFTAVSEPGMYYDRPLKRWVPAGPPALSEDGLRYAYVLGDQTSSRLHLFDLQTNTDNVVAEGGPWRVVGVQPDAVYVDLVEYLPYSEAYGQLVADRGLWKVPSDGTQPVQLTSDSRGWIVEGGAAWGGAGLNIAGGPNDIVRFDLRTKQTTTWFAPGKRSTLMAVDASGVPLIITEADSFDLWRVAAPDSAVKIWSGSPDGLGPYLPSATDGKSVWFSSRTSYKSSEAAIYRYSAARGLEKMADFTGHSVAVAGPCA